MAAKEPSKKKQNRVRVGDEVQIHTGEHAGRTATVKSVNRDTNRVEVEIPDLPDQEKILKHQKPTNDLPGGAILKLNPTNHMSNVMKLEVWNDRPKQKSAAAQ